ncbi:MAG: hypothetical protein JEY99_17100 [Spirochaetales bacterium]|nr:hypothetical protein [Spirochaetales bacterium]
MNQDQVKELLLKLDSDAPPFKLIFSGKKSKKVHGLYHPEDQEIIIHNKNFENDGTLLYTAIHEFAHHLHFTRSHRPVGSRSHTGEFRQIFHRLLERAEELSIMENRYNSNDDLATLTREIKEHYLKGQGDLARKLGEALIKAEELCRKYELRFEDYLERILQFDKNTARVVMRMPSIEAPPELGYENLKLIASKVKPEAQKVISEKLTSGESRDCAKTEEEPEALTSQVVITPRDRLIMEKARLEKTIESLESKLNALNNRLDELEY